MQYSLQVLGMMQQQQHPRLPRPVPLAPIAAAPPPLPSGHFSSGHLAAPPLDQLMGSLYPWGALTLPIPRPPFPFYMPQTSQSSDFDGSKGKLYKPVT